MIFFSEGKKFKLNSFLNNWLDLCQSTDWIQTFLLAFWVKLVYPRREKQPTLNCRRKRFRNEEKAMYYSDH